MAQYGLLQQEIIHELNRIETPVVPHRLAVELVREEERSVREQYRATVATRLAHFRQVVSSLSPEQQRTELARLVRARVERRLAVYNRMERPRAPGRWSQSVTQTDQDVNPRMTVPRGL